MKETGISVVIPTYLREVELVETSRAVLGELGEGDEIVVVDQTPRHEPETVAAITNLVASGRVRWLRKGRPSICEAMNVGALVARNEVIVFLDDDIEPGPGLLEVYRQLFSRPGSPHAVNGQVLQPWHDGPVRSVRDFELGFDFAYAEPAEVVPMATGNCAVVREVFLASGGMDENFRGGAYRCDADLGYRLRAFTGQPARFEPRASVRHLQAGGGTRAHGAKDSWASIDSAIGDYYLGLRWFGWRGALRHSLQRMLRAPVNRRTLSRPWLVPWLGARELVAFGRAVMRVWRAPVSTIQPLDRYTGLEELPAAGSPRQGPGVLLRDD